MRYSAEDHEANAVVAFDEANNPWMLSFPRGKKYVSKLEIVVVFDPGIGGCVLPFMTGRSDRDPERMREVGSRCATD